MSATSIAVAAARNRAAMVASTWPIDARSARTSTAPSAWPSTRAVPSLGCPSAPARVRSVVLPAPFGPIIAQRSPGRATQSMSSSSTARSLPRWTRQTPTPAISMAVVIALGH